MSESSDPVRALLEHRIAQLNRQIASETGEIEHHKSYAAQCSERLADLQVAVAAFEAHLATLEVAINA